jgi:thymidylate kinase
MVIIEGADGTGKTTLAHGIAKWLDAQYIHCSYHPSWDIETYHRHVLHFAGKLEEQSSVEVVIDRWAISEAAYGNAYRSKPAYDTKALHDEAMRAYNPTLIYCHNNQAIENHKTRLFERDEMFEDISPVVEQYENIMASGDYASYIPYDYTNMDMSKFIVLHFYHWGIA